MPNECSTMHSVCQLAVLCRDIWQALVTKLAITLQPTGMLVPGFRLLPLKLPFVAWLHILVLFSAFSALLIQQQNIRNVHGHPHTPTDLLRLSVGQLDFELRVELERTWIHCHHQTGCHHPGYQEPREKLICAKSGALSIRLYQIGRRDPCKQEREKIIGTVQ